MNGYMRTMSMPLYNFSQFEFCFNAPTEIIMPTSFVIKKCKVRSTWDRTYHTDIICDQEV